MALIGYARVSTEDQSLDPQLIELRDAGCTTIREEHASGAKRSRPVLARLIREIAPGDTLIVVRLDRLARSLSHLLQVIEHLEERGAHFRSLGDPIDTSTPQGKFSLQVIGAVAELERALIRERTVAGLKAARAAGRIGGNPGLRARDRDALRANAIARDETYFRRLEEQAETWVPLVRRHRPAMTWDDLARLINGRLPPGAKPWSVERLRRAARRYVADGLLEKNVLSRSASKPAADRLVAIIASMKNADPYLTLEEICRRLERMREPTPRGASSWYPSSVRHLLKRAEASGLLSVIANAGQS